MISAMRRLAGTWFAKLLFVLLVLSFAIWGIEDVIRNFGRDTAVVRVGNETIELNEAQLAARRETQRLQRQLGAAFEASEPVREAVARQALDALITDRAQRVEAHRIGVATPTEAVRAYVFSIPGFQTGGQFDRRILDNFLRQNELDEAGFQRLVVADLQRQQMFGAVQAGASAPEEMLRLMLRWQGERRSAALVQVAVADAPAPAEPTEDQLRRFHENEAARFSAPERRTATLALLSADALAAGIDVPEADIRAAYDNNAARFGTPERRRVEQALMPNEDAARSVIENWTADTPFAAVEERVAALGGSAVDLGEIDRGGLPIPELAGPIFAAAEGTVAGPVRTPFGWHVLRVVGVSPGSLRPFEEVRDELRAEIARERAADQVYERANRVEDALAGGATVEEAAREFDLRVATVTVAADGTGSGGARASLPVPNASRADALRRVFAASPGTPRLEEVPAGYLAIDLREVTPAALRPFDEVRDAVREAWDAEQRRRWAEERAAALLAAVRGGTALPDAARAANAEATTIGPFNREAPTDGPEARENAARELAAGLTPELRAAIFAAGRGEATMVRTPGGYSVAALTAVEPGGTDDETARVAMRTELETTLQADLEEQYNAALRARAGVRVNDALVNQVATR